MRQLRVELSRFRSRRAIAAILLISFGLVALITVTTLWEHRPVTDADLASAQAEAERQGNRPAVQREIAQCEKNPRMFLGRGASAADCAEMMTPQPEWFMDRAPLELQSVATEAGVALMFLLAAAGLLVGATFIGADWASGSVGNQLLFQPERSRIWWAKAAAVVLGLSVAAGVMLAIFWGTMWFFHRSWDGPVVRPDFWSDTGWMQLRGLGLVAGATLGGYALTVFFRHTGAALGVLLGYAVVGEMILRSLGIATIQEWLVSHNVFAWLFDGYPVFVRPAGCQDIFECGVQRTISVQAGGLYLAALLAVAVGLSWLAFRRRDIP